MILGRGIFLPGKAKHRHISGLWNLYNKTQIALEVLIAAQPAAGLIVQVLVHVSIQTRIESGVSKNQQGWIDVSQRFDALRDLLYGILIIHNDHVGALVFGSGLLISRI
jgi:hypothetical protein